MADDLSFNIEAKDNASEVVERVASDAEALEKLDPKIDVTADTGSAEARLAGLADKAERADKATRGLGEGSKVGGNAVADLAGPFGQAEGAASTMGGVFDGLGDIVEGIGPKFGLSADAAEKAAMTLGLVGLAAAAGAALWNAYSESQKKARQATKDLAEDMTKVSDALAAGDVPKATEALSASFQRTGLDITKVAESMGVSVGAVYDYLTGKTDEVMGATEGTTAQAYFLRQGFDEAAAAAKRSGDAEAALSVELAKEAAATEHVIEVEAAMRDARRGAADATIAYGDAVVAVGDAHAATEAALVAMTDGTTDAATAARAYDDAVRAERDAQIAAADAAGQLAAQNAAASGSTDTAAAETKAYNDSLLASAATTTGPVRDALVKHIATLNGIPESEVTAILATTPNLAEQSAAIDQAARDRTAKINVDFIPQLDRLEAAYRSGAAPRPTTAGRAAAPSGTATVGVRAGATVAVPVAVTPNVTVHVDARGAADPYAVGRTIQENLTAWSRVAGRWRPGGYQRGPT